MMDISAVWILWVWGKIDKKLKWRGNDEIGKHLRGDGNRESRSEKHGLRFEKHGLCFHFLMTCRLFGSALNIFSLRSFLSP
jgi:hypothetical protein